MKRLTTDTPDGNFETMLNFVFSKDGWAHIKYDGEAETVPLTQWAKAQCTLHGCDEFTAETPQEIDEEICDCMMDFSECPVALAYCFAVQACHLRSRLKMYEDILFDEDGKEQLTLDKLRVLMASNNPLTLDDLREMDGEPVWVEAAGAREEGRWGIVDGVNIDARILFLLGDFSCYDYGGDWLAYRRKPEDETK